MIKEHIQYLVCPECQGDLNLLVEKLDGFHVMEGELVCNHCGRKYNISKGIPRFVPQENYAKNFGLEWHKHSRTQYDENSGFSISEERFINETQWGKQLKKELILEAGSGSGRFTKHAIETGAMVVSFDYSLAVEANFKSNGHCENLLIVQASIFEMPFRKKYFTHVFCFGVLQHTPDPEKAFSCLVSSLRGGGYICSDIYLKSITWVFLTPKYLLRKFTKKSDPEKLYESVKSYINFVWPVVRVLQRIPKLGKQISWRFMVPDYSSLLPDADEKTLKEWAILDSYDMLSPAYDYPQTLKTFKKWHINEGLSEIDVHYGYNGIVGRARSKV
jgi:uncharacterized protein YbaR (Trm112 family)/2-polyprenyl-3-methyl-5-hydroxy-6-metoxy-1,4-benzoquinol methylase